MSHDVNENGFISHLAELRKRLINSFIFLYGDGRDDKEMFPDLLLKKSGSRTQVFGFVPRFWRV